MSENGRAQHARVATRLICVDVDGTLVGSSGIVDDVVWRAAERVRASGIRLAVCSGRPGFGTSRDIAERLEPDGWHSFQNGASVVNLATGRSLSTALAPELVRTLIERARATGRILELYTDATYAEETRAERAVRHAGLLGIPYSPESFASLDGRIVRAQWLLPIEQADAVLAEPHPGLEVSPSTSPLMPDTLFVNLTPAGIDKATAVRAVSAEYGFSLDEVMFVGDGRNDASAMRIVGRAVAMGNAEPEALEVAPVTVGHVDDAGLAEALELALAA